MSALRRTGVLAVALLTALVVPLVVAPGASAQAPDTCLGAAGPDAEAGWTAYRAGDMDEARARFAAALSLCPESAYARTGLGYVELREGNEGEADLLFRDALATDPGSVDALVGLGLLAWRADDLETARERFLQVERLAPGHPTAQDYLARLRAGRRSTPEEADPGEAGDPQSDPADRAWREGDMERARALYRARLEDNPSDGAALHRLALMRAWEEDHQGALELLDRLIEVEPENLDARVDRARVVAWRGDVDQALAELDALLAEHPELVSALRARALFEAWAGRYEASLASYDELLAIAPGRAETRRSQAQVLVWADRFEDSRAVYDSLLARDPDDVEARLALARVLSLADHLDEAEAEYRRILEDHPDDVRALQGLGRTLGWAGKLVQGEETLRRARRADPEDVATLVGLAQILRWQGRNAAALEVLDEARVMAPADSDVREQLRWVRVALGERVRPSVAVEHDSDDNRMVTAAAVGEWHPLPRLGLRADVYQRVLSQGALERSTWGMTATASWQLEPGWTVAAGAGGSRSDGPGARSFASWRLSASSPGRYAAGATVTLSSSSLDATARLAEVGVRMTELSVTGRWAPAPGWRVDGSLGRATFEATEDNRRLNASLSASRRLDPRWTLGAGLRTFAFEKDLADGYFDPDFYGIGEVTLRWLWERGAWSVLLEAAPGVQQVTEDGDPAGTVRGSGRLAWRLAPGRELSLSGGYSSAGLQSFSTGDAGYRYSAVILGASWVF